MSSSNKKYIYIYIFLILLVILFNNGLGRNLNKVSSPQILGFQINGIGNGHLTQSKTVYDVLIKKYKIPIVIIYGRNEGYDNFFLNSKVIYQKINTTNESINDMNYLKVIKDFIKIKPTHKYEKIYGINKWFNFFVNDFLNFRTKQIIIASQFSIDNIKNYLLINSLQLSSICILVSIHISSKYTKYTIPPLIKLEKIKRIGVNKKIILAYSVSGEDFPKKLDLLSKKNPLYKFIYFTNTNIQKPLQKNITLYKPDKIKFIKYLRICGAVLCTSGNELILECVFNKIPVATSPCSNKQYEQVDNFNKYVEFLKYSESFTDSLDLEVLVNKKMESSHSNLIKSCENRDQKILKLCNI